MTSEVLAILISAVLAGASENPVITGVFIGLMIVNVGILVIDRVVTKR